jgi:hypothetical protein
MTHSERIGLRFFLVILLARSLSPTGARAASPEPPLLAEVSASNQELRDDDNHPDYRFPVVGAAGVSAEALLCEVVDVGLGELHDPALLHGAFAPHMEPGQGKPSALIVHVDFAKVRRPGTYDVSIRVLGPNSTEQKVLVKLTHPAARLATVPPLVVDREVGLGDPAVLPVSVQLKEESGATRVTDLVVEQSGASVRNDLPVSGTVLLEDPAHPKSLSLSASESKRLNVKLQGEFPVGVSRGTVSIRGEQLKDPVSFAFEVRTRRSGWLVIPIFLLAAALGWFVRVFLKRREQLLEVSFQALDRREQLRRLVESHPVPDVVTKLQEVDRALEEALDGRDAAEIAKKIALADPAIAAAMASYEKFKAELAAQMEDEAAAFNRSTGLPAEWGVPELRAGLEKVRDLMAADQVRDAAAERARLGETSAKLIDKGKSWAHTAGQQLQALESEEIPWPVSYQGAIKEHIAAMKAPVAAVEAQKNPALVDALNRLDDAFAVLRDRIADIGFLVRRAADDLAAELAARDEFKTEVAACVADLPEETGGVAVPTAVLGAIPGVVRQLDKVFAAAARSQVQLILPGAGDDEVERLLAARAYTKAIKAAIAAAPKEREDKAARPSGGQPSVPEAQELRRAKPPSPIPVAAPGRDRVVVVTSPRFQPLTRERLRNELTVNRVLMAGAAAVVLSFVAWILYGGKFVGTPEEIGAIAAFGFTSDFTLATVADSLGRLRK